jgi:serine/threonine protein kinase
VFLCHRRDNPDRKLAVKVLKKHEVIEKNLVSQVIAERNALAITKSPFCVNLFYCLQTPDNVFLVSFTSTPPGTPMESSLFNFFSIGYGVHDRG